MIRHPFQSLPAPIAVALFIASVVALWVLASKTIDRGLRVEAAPLGIISFELAGTTERARAIMGAWGNELSERAKAVQRWDYLLIVAYSTLLALLVAGVGEISRDEGFFAELAGVFAWAVFAAGLLDVAENLALARVFEEDAAQPWPRLAQIAAGAKFTLLFAVGAFLVVGGATAAWAALSDGATAGTRTAHRR